MLWGHILPYPKDGLVQPKHILRDSSPGKTTSHFLRYIWQTDCKPRTASNFFVWLPFSANTIAFTFHPLFELFFHRSYLKTTTYIYIYIYIKREKKERQVLARELKRFLEHESDGDPYYNWFDRNSPQRLSRRTNRHHPNYGIVEIDQNSEKNPGDLRGLAVTQIPVKDNQQTIAWKTRKEKYNNIHWSHR